MSSNVDRIQGLLGDLGIKPPVLVATTGAITLYGPQTIDGVSVIAGNRVLVKNQADAITNGVYDCRDTIWVRSLDFDGTRDAVQGTSVLVATGTVNELTLWALTTTDPIVGLSELTFASYGGGTDEEVVPYDGAFTTLGGISRQVSAKLGEAVSVKDFGATGDGVTNDTTAIGLARDYMLANGVGIYVPPGTYLTDPFVINSQSYTLQAGFFGTDRESTIIKRRTTGVGAFITQGASNGTIFQSGVGFSHITIDGGAATNGDAFVGYDMVRSSFTDCRFKGGSVAFHSYGGISLTFNDCLFDSALTGFRAEWFSSSAGGGWPNLIRINGGEVVDNATYGVYFNDGRMLILKGVDVEGNGTTLAAANGGLYVGPNIGAEVTASDTYSQGVIVRDCWFEANKGIADIYLNSGNNAVSDSQFFSTSVQTTNDIRIDGGRYGLRGINCSFSKTANILEGASTRTGNTIEVIEAPNITFTEAKTSLYDGSFFNLRNGRVPGINGTTAPLMLVGSDATGVNPTITFSTAFKAATVPKVYLQVVSNNATTLDAPEAYSVSNSGFTIRKKSHNGTSIGTLNYTVYWLAIGESV